MFYDEDTGLPHEDYGFVYDPKDNDKNDSNFEDFECIIDHTVPFRTKEVTHRVMAAEYGEVTGVTAIGGQTYMGQSIAAPLVGKITGYFFNLEEMDESLQMAADCITEEIYEAMCELFTGNRMPKKGSPVPVSSRILYLTGVYVHKDHRGNGLGNEIVRNLVSELGNHEDFDCGLVLLCPAADPHPGSSAAWNAAFDSLAAMFEKLHFQRCGAKNRRTGRSKYMFLDVFENYEDLEPQRAIVAAADPAPSMTGSSAEAVFKRPVGSLVTPSVVVSKRLKTG